MGNVKIPWLVALVIISYRDMKKGATNNIGGLPLPADYLASFVIFGALSLLTGEAEKVGTVAGWGFVVAMALNLTPASLAPNAKTTNTATGTTAQNPAAAPSSAGFNGNPAQPNALLKGSTTSRPAA